MNFERYYKGLIKGYNQMPIFTFKNIEYANQEENNAIEESIRKVSCEFKEYTINLTEIKEIKFQPVKLKNRNGSFKKWTYRGIIITEYRTYLNVPEGYMKDLKNILKCKLELRYKETFSEFKNHSERKCIYYHYDVIH